MKLREMKNEKKIVKKKKKCEKFTSVQRANFHFKWFSTSSSQTRSNFSRCLTSRLAMDGLNMENISIRNFPNNFANSTGSSSGTSGRANNESFNDGKIRKNSVGKTTRKTSTVESRKQNSSTFSQHQTAKLWWRIWIVCYDARELVNKFQPSEGAREKL